MKRRFGAPGNSSCLAQLYEDVAPPLARLRNKMHIEAYPVEEFSGLLIELPSTSTRRPIACPIRNSLVQGRTATAGSSRPRIPVQLVPLPRKTRIEPGAFFGINTFEQEACASPAPPAPTRRGTLEVDFKDHALDVSMKMADLFTIVWNAFSFRRG